MQSRLNIAQDLIALITNAALSDAPGEHQVRSIIRFPHPE
jgi:hypothetical protein